MRGSPVSISAPVLHARNLSVEYFVEQQWQNVLRDVEMCIEPREIHGLVGESGSGKSTLGLALMRALSSNGRIVSGSIVFEDRDITQLSTSELASIWGRRISFVPQNPMEALNPSLTIGRQMSELALILGAETARAALEQSISLLETVQIPDPGRIVSRYPHQLSGGMLQRVMIAMALSSRPAIIILDEPTTALDLTTQATILDLLRELIQREGTAALYISHDLGTVAELCDSITVLYAGEIMEFSAVAKLFAQPVHPYTRGLIACLPNAVRGRDSRLQTIGGIAPSLSERLEACVFSERCPYATDTCRKEKPPLIPLDPSESGGTLVRCWHWERILDHHEAEAAGRSSSSPPLGNGKEKYALKEWESTLFSARNIRKSFIENPGLAGLWGKKKQVLHAVEQVNIDIAAGQTVGLVGESGSGKTTFARTIVALNEADEGSMCLRGFELSSSLSARKHEILRGIRMVFQNPGDALNPYHTVGFAIGRTFKKLNPKALSQSQIRQEVFEILNQVGLGPDYYHRFPNQLSGGEKQRVAIARAFAAAPSLIVADEPTSSLNVSVQAVILNLLKDLRSQQNVSYLFISHDLEVIEYLSEYIAVMYLGEIVEQGITQDVMAPPYHPYTEALLAAAPSTDPTLRRKRIRLKGEIPSPREKPRGCPFHTRCQHFIGKICEETVPPLRKSGTGHQIRCHHDLDTLIELQKESFP